MSKPKVGDVVRIERDENSAPADGHRMAFALSMVGGVVPQ